MVVEIPTQNNCTERDHFFVLAIIVKCQVPQTHIQVLNKHSFILNKGLNTSTFPWGLHHTPFLFPIQAFHEIVLQQEKTGGGGKKKNTNKQTPKQTDLSAQNLTPYFLFYLVRKWYLWKIHQYKTNIYQSTLAHTEILWLLSFLNSAIESGIFALHTWSKHVQMVFLDRLGFEKEIEISDTIHQILGSYTAFKAENLHPMRYTHFSKQLLQ